MLAATLDTSFKVSESQSLKDLLSFSLSKVKNLYTLDLSSLTFKFEHKDGEYVAKANTKLTSSTGLFEASYIDSFKTEYGISYVGYILIEFVDSSFTIWIPADKSFDPAGNSDELWVESRQIHKLIVFVCVMIIVARYGAESKFIRRLFKVMNPIVEKYYKKKFLFKWMFEQVRLACIRQRQPMSYTEFIGESGIESAIRYNEDVKLVQSGTIDRVSFPEEYSTVIKHEMQEADAYGFEGGDGVVDVVIPRCFSPDLDEDTVPNILEIKNDLVKVKEKYEETITQWMKKISELENSKKKLSEKFMIELKFEQQCPVF